MSRIVHLAGFVALAIIPAEADAAGKRSIDNRQDRQEARINNGIDSGAPTARETRRLERGEERIENVESAFQSDGNITERERAKVQGLLNLQIGWIYRQKHDGQTQ